jgi:hypothetical protein
LLFPDAATFERINMNHTTEDDDAAAKKAVELFNASIYASKAGEVGLYFEQLAVRQKALTALLTPRLGDGLLRADGTPWLSGLTRGAPRLNVDDLTQVASLPLNSRLRIDPWDDKVDVLNVKPAALLNPGDKMPFEVTPIFYSLQPYQAPAEPAPASAAAASAPAPANGNQPAADANQAPPPAQTAPADTAGPAQGTSNPPPADANQTQGTSNPPTPDTNQTQGTSNPPPTDTNQTQPQAPQQ